MGEWGDLSLEGGLSKDLVPVFDTQGILRMMQITFDFWVGELLLIFRAAEYCPGTCRGEHHRALILLSVSSSSSPLSLWCPVFGRRILVINNVQLQLIT
mmetsp:Transcript_40719/g.66217  ORF Transcript_40719/g.66217 Transcript_40719/m.66217 type:complete len:99 (+) Transcript_40719:1152-1448(+)